jgi:cytochrome c biogenesis protein CcmG, thiol:disulfide interchange protein DsbE
MKKGLGYGAIVLALLFALQWTASPPSAKAPDFVLPDLQGKAVGLSQLRGKVVFLNIWATWCPPCRKEMPTMEALYQKFKDMDFVMLAINQDTEGAKTVIPYLREEKFTFPILLDTSGETGRKYGVTGYPETFIIDREGRIVYHHIGYQDWSRADVQETLRTLMTSGTWSGEDTQPGEQSPTTLPG